jgi:chromosome segregation ATPase
LGIAEARIEELENEIADLNSRRESLERARARTVRTYNVVKMRMEVVETALREMGEALDALSDESSS